VVLRGAGAERVGTERGTLALLESLLVMRFSEREEQHSVPPRRGGHGCHAPILAVDAGSTVEPRRSFRCDAGGARLTRHATQHR
jgi:hypothetical protein